MYIFDFEKFFYDTNLKKAQNLVSRNKIVLTDSDESSYIFKTQETSESKQIINVDPFGNVQYMDCSCYDTWYCHHKAAALYMTAKLLKEKYNGSSPVVSFLTEHYSSSVVENAVSEASNRKIRLEPSLKNGRYGISLSLRIGYDKMYSVKNVMKLKENFMKMRTEVYGKNTAITHLYSNLDDGSAKLLDLAVSASVYAQQTLEAKNTSGLIPLSGDFLENFLTLFNDKEVIYENGLYNVRFEDIRLPLFISKTEDRKFRISMSDDDSDNQFTCIGQGRCMCFRGDMNRTMYVCSEKFKMYVSSFYNLLSKSQFQIIVSAQDMPSFYSSVLNPLHFALDIHGEELLKSYIPPEVQVNLYIDSPEPEVINGRLEFAYQYKSYQAFNGQKSNTRDLRTEAIAEKIVSKYFDVMENDLHHPLVVTGDNRIYDLLSAGIPELSKYMDIYASEKFNRMKIRTNPRISVGVHPESSLLEIDITSVEYTAEELAELLTSYRQGHKYHRLKDGSFTILDQSFADLDQLTRNLNIKDKSLLKEKIKVPLYRMLYLDSLNSSNSSLKFNRSSLFRSEIRKFRDMSASEDFSVDPSLTEIMREYQKHGFAWMKTICRYGFGGILADDMGLGKTLQAIALMLDLKNSDKENKKSLVVCPASLTLNWENEIMKFAPSLSTAVIIGNTFQRAELFNTCMDKDVIITSYTTLTRDILEYEDITFGLHFIDEAQFIKNHSTQMAKAVKSIKSEIRFALTGTPVENSLAELWSIFDFIMPDYLFTYSYFKKTFENQIVKNHDEVSVYELQKLTSPFILRRMKKDVLTELPDKTITVLPVKMETEQEKIYLANLLELKKTLTSGGMNDNEHRFRILAMLTRLRQICCDPSLVYENYESGSAKLTQCLDLVESCAESGHKVLLFSQFTSMLDIIRKNLEQKKISYCLLEGKTKPKDRISMVERFNSDDTKVFLISLKAGGTGLNLTSADIVIHYDPWWNASAENQATDRAYRIGQRNNVQVYKLITENTIEEKIQKLQKMKTELAELSLSGTSDLMTLSSEEIIDLLDI